MGESGRSGIVVEREWEREGVVVVGIGIMPRLRLGGAVISGDSCFLPSLSLIHIHTLFYAVEFRGSGIWGLGRWRSGSFFFWCFFETLLAWDCGPRWASRL